MNTVATVTVAAIPFLATLVLALRYRLLAEIWKSEKEAHEEKAERLHEEKEQLQSENAKLRAATDLTAYMAVAQERHDQIMRGFESSLKALEALAAKLNTAS